MTRYPRPPAGGPYPSGEQRPGYGTLPPRAGTRGTETVYRPPYLPGQEPLPPRQRPRRASPIIAPLLALVGLLIVGGGSLWAFSFLAVDLAGEAGDASPSPGPALAAAASVEPGSSVLPLADATPVPDVEPDPTDPPDIVEPPPDERADVTGTIIFSRAGDIWAASGRELRRLTDADATKSDSMPTWSPDGKQIYFIRTTRRTTPDARGGGLYTLYVTDLYRMKADGSQKQPVYESLIKGASGTWFSHVLQPDVSPRGDTVAVVSDGPDGSGPVELHLVSARGGRIQKVAAPAEGDLGHNDPAFSPDGRRIAFTYNGAQGTDGAPRIGIHECRTARDCAAGSTKLLRPGYGHPSWAPDGSWLAVEATRGTGRDIALIDPRRGDVRVLLTDDGDSFAPVVSPNGDQIAYLHRDGVDIDVRVMTLETAPDGKITLIDDSAVTDDGSIDGDSPPEWFIPEDQRLAPANEATGVLEAQGSGAPEPLASGAAGGAPPPP